jgi:hypothetical protein
MSSGAIVFKIIASAYLLASALYLKDSLVSVVTFKNGLTATPYGCTGDANLGDLDGPYPATFAYLASQYSSAITTNAINLAIFVYSLIKYGGML